MEARQLRYQIRHSDLHPTSKWGKKSAREREREDWVSYREEISKDNSIFLMESLNAGTPARRRATGTTAPSGVRRRGSGRGTRG